ncbi:hypothetical protein [Aquimarina rubra]|uniref:Uncharacterized protein n=1 Tax=Aquimarina rubra TaxID=1920033 RepID=A0ABW5LHA2_9FLAO
MKNYKTKIQSGVFLLFLLIGISSCQKEELENLTENNELTRKEVAISTVAAKDVPVLQDFVATKMGNLPQKSSEGTTMVDSPFGLIPLEEITEVINLDGNINYTFKIYPKNPKKHSFYNLIVQPSMDGGEPISFVLEYTMDKDFEKDYFFNKKGLDEYVGTIKKYTVDAFINTDINKQSVPCPCAVANVSPGGNTLGGVGGSGGGVGSDDNPPDGSGQGDDYIPRDGDGSEGGANSGGSSGGGGSCSIHIITDCHENWPPYRPCPIVGIITTCTDSKSSAKSEEDCPIDPEGECPDNSGYYGVNDIELTQFLEIGIPERFVLSFDANQNLIDDIGHFLYSYDGNDTNLAIAKELSKQLGIAFARGELNKEFTKAFFQNEYTPEVMVEMTKAIKVFNQDAAISTLNTVTANQFFVNLTGVNLSLKGGDFSEYAQAWLPSNLDPDDVLGLSDWLIISGQALRVKDLALGYPLANEETRIEILNKIGERSATVALAAPLKSIVGEYWPQSDEEWKAIGEIAAPLLLEVGLAAIPGSDIIEVVRGIANDDYWQVAAAIAGLTVDLFGATVVKVIAKFGKAVYKAFKIVRAVGDFLTEVGQVIARGFEIVYENAAAVLKDASGRILAQGDDLVQSFLKTSGKLESLGLDPTLLNDPDIIKAFQRIDCN